MTAVLVDIDLHVYMQLRAPMGVAESCEPHRDLLCAREPSKDGWGS